MPEAGIFFVIVFVILAIAAIVLHFLGEKKRREAFAALAARLGLRFRAGKDRALAKRYSFLDKLRQGSNRYACNILEGKFAGCPVCAFDYHYQVNSGKNTHHYNFSFFILEQERFFPELRIYPEGLLSKLGQMVGFADIDFESVEFSRAFCVRSPDRKFAYDICHPRMMECLLQHRNLSLEIEGRCVSMSFGLRLDPEQIPGRLAQLVEIRRMFPEYLYEK